MLPIFPWVQGNSEVPPEGVSDTIRTGFAHKSDRFRTQKSQTPLSLAFMTIKHLNKYEQKALAICSANIHNLKTNKKFKDKYKVNKIQGPPQRGFLPTKTRHEAKNVRKFPRKSK